MPVGKSIPKKVLNTFLEETPKLCVRRKDGNCSTHLTIEHPFGRSGELSHVLIWLCERHHGLGAYWSKEDFNKEINKYYGYLTVDDKDLAKMKLGNQYLQEKKYLIGKHGDNLKSRFSLVL
jgi:hypothetical protein